MARQAWRDSFFMAADGTKPAEEWLLALPSKSAAEAIAVVKAVRDAPPPAFAGGGKWEAIPESVYRRVRERRDAYQATRSVDFS